MFKTKPSTARPRVAPAEHKGKKMSKGYKKQNIEALQLANKKRKENKEKAKRRTGLYHALGFSLTEISQKLNISYAAVKLHINELRAEWKEDFSSLELDDFLATLMLSISIRKRQAQTLYQATRMDNVKLGALKLMGDEDERMVRLLQSLGKIEKAPERLKIEDDLEKEFRKLFEKNQNGIPGFFEMLDARSAALAAVEGDRNGLNGDNDTKGS